MNPKQSGTITLMASSLVALLLFLGFWLYKGYEEAESVMLQQGNLLYKESLQQVEDSLFQQVIQAFITRVQTGDSLTMLRDSTAQRLIDLSVRHVGKTRPFETLSEGPPQEAGLGSRITLRIDSIDSEPGDTMIFLEGFDTRIETRVYQEKDPQLDSMVRRTFLRKLYATDLPRQFGFRPITVDTTEGKLAPSNFAPFHQQELYFEQAAPYLLGKLSGQLIFSFFLFGLTALAFGVLYRSNQRALQYTQLKNDFISNMTHELKTPITTVGVAIEAIRGFVAANDREKMLEYLQISEHELGRLTLLVDKVLKLSMFENEVPTLKREPLDIRLVARRVIDAMTIQVEQQHGRVAFSATGEDFSLRGDEVHLTNVLYTLMDNSLKYSLERPVLSLAIEADEQRLTLRLQDNGMGIPAAYQDKVFDRFFRVPAGDRHNVKGYGLGLTYVADIIHRHGGSIQLESAAGQGTTFIIELPRNHG
jgi:two-component system phosphate regulon sensor histidine kinase PhoR